MTYDEAAAYDYGSWFSLKFVGEKLPLLTEVLQLARENGVLIKIDDKIWNFPEKHKNCFWKLLRDSQAELAITCSSLKTVRIAVRELPSAEIHYGGEVTEEILKELCLLNERLVVWLPFQSKATSWVRVPFASEDLCRLVKRYAKLGIWIVSNYEDFDEICERFEPDIVETPGQIKPIKNSDCLVDMHTHSEHSHDSTCPIREMARKQQERGMYGFAVTDHCDLFSYEQGNVAMNIQKSVAEVRALCEDEEKERASIENTRKIHILSGVELGESIWYPDVEEQVIHMCDYDVVIGSVHTVRYKEYDMPYSCIDFSEMDTKEIYGYLNGYFDDVLQMVQSNPCDVVAHLAYPLRYINGKYGLGIDCKRFEEKIRKILSAIIQRGIALEVNTSCMCEDDIDWLNQDWLLGIYREIGGLLITLGSDAHISENAAREFDRAVALLRKHGFRNCFYYEKRKSIQCTI